MTKTTGLRWDFYDVLQSDRLRNIKNGTIRRVLLSKEGDFRLAGRRGRYIAYAHAEVEAIIRNSEVDSIRFTRDRHGNLLNTRTALGFAASAVRYSCRDPIPRSIAKCLNCPWLAHLTLLNGRPKLSFG